MKITRKQLSSLIRECLENRNAESLDMMLETMASLVNKMYSNTNTDDYSGSSAGGITVGVSDPSLSVSSTEPDLRQSFEADELDEDEEVIDEDEDDIEEGEY